jgi:hypothetical protein
VKTESAGKFFKDKSTIFAMLADVFAITGVLFFSWSPFRIIGFYWLDTCIGIIFLLIYFMRCKVINSAGTFLMSASFLFLLMYVYLNCLLSFTNEIDSHAHPLEWQELFYPYFDISIFFIFSAFSHYHRLRKISTLVMKDALPFNAISTVIGMVMVPSILLVSIWLNFIFGNMNLAMITSLVLLRNMVEFWRFSSIVQMAADRTQPAS